MIVNMHIRKDWQKWLVPKDSNKRITAVCGTKTSEKFAGIPAVTEQPVYIDKNGNLGWCVHCCGLALDQFNKTFEKNISSGFVKSQYTNAVEIMARQIFLGNKKK